MVLVRLWANECSLSLQFASVRPSVRPPPLPALTAAPGLSCCACGLLPALPALPALHTAAVALLGLAILQSDRFRRNLPLKGFNQSRTTASLNAFIVVSEYGIFESMGLTV